MKQLHIKFKELREDRDLKQQDIAEMLGIKQQQYSLYETGKRSFPIDIFRKLCIFYQQSADNLLDIKIKK